jgi:hypothetical protein
MNTPHPPPYHGHGKERPDLPAIPNTAPYAGQVWVHVKTQQEYIIRGLARSEKTGEIVVLYEWLDGINLRPQPNVPWMRPLSEWDTIITLLDGTSSKRFLYRGMAG